MKGFKVQEVGFRIRVQDYDEFGNSNLGFGFKMFALGIFDV